MIKAVACTIAIAVLGVPALVVSALAQDAAKPSDAPSFTFKGDDGSVRTIQIPEDVWAGMKQEAIDQLVDRFDAPACLKAKSTYRGRQEDAKGAFILRVYEAPTACAEELNAAMKSFEFRRIDMNAYAGGSPDGTTERLRFGYAVAPNKAVIAWEEDLK